MSSGVASLSTGLGQLASLSTSLTSVTSLSTSLKPLANALTAAAGNGATIGVTTIGGANSDGTIQTRGANGTVISNVNPATCGTVTGVDATGSGLCAKATKDGATAFGSNAQATDANTTAVGFRAVASQAGSVAIGNNAQATGDPTVAIGQNSVASGNNSVATGAGAQATGTNAVATGAGAQAAASNSVALGAGSIADQANTVSVGSPGSERRITNVAPGVDPTDAVNVSQLSAVQNQVNNVQKTAYAGIAMSMALTGTVMPSLDAGEKGVGVGIGSFQGNGALALQFKSVSQTGNSSWGAGVSTTGKTTGVTVGYGFKWK
ncbi:YadA family autotransporter adhesin [Glaciimonas soli]|uniref:YadA family autotransporter adhesin n=1 Tax=Glaciimonas soli TaxID=2590999 RepID=UPI002240F390|nr:YadA-like family protein [Glaciimonas soli]